jgi:hypothetical protein
MKASKRISNLRTDFSHIYNSNFLELAVQTFADIISNEDVSKRAADKTSRQKEFDHPVLIIY